MLFIGNYSVGLIVFSVWYGVGNNYGYIESFGGRLFAFRFFWGVEI